MPRCLAPASLRRAALQAVCDEFELICYGVSRHSHQFRSFLKTGGYLNHQDQPPLRQLPVHVFTELVAEVLEQLGSSPHVLHAVIQPQMAELRLPSTLSTIPLAIKLLVERVNRLATFELTCCKSLSPLILAAALPYLPSLTRLNVEGTNFDEFGLEQLGQHVHHLHTLNVARTRVTDRGLAGLTGRLQELTFCILLSNRVSQEGVVTLLVEHPGLVTLEYERMREVLALLASLPYLKEARLASLSDLKETVLSSLQDLKETQLHLRKVVLETCREEAGPHLQNCQTILPLLEAVSLNNSDLTPSLTLSLSKYRHLEKLELGNSLFTQYTASFLESVVPLLEVVGGQLTHLSLENFKFFDVTHVGRLCPKLLSLKLSNILSYCRAENQRQKVFRNLEELYIFNTRWGSITEGMLRQLLTSTSLRTVNLQLVNSLTDELFQEILLHNTFPCLEFLTLEQCHRVSVDLLETLLSLPGPLASLHVWGCASIGPISKERLVAILLQRRLDVNLQWQDVPEENLGDWDILQEDGEDDPLLQDLLLPMVGVNVLPDPM